MSSFFHGITDFWSQINPYQKAGIFTSTLTLFFLVRKYVAGGKVEPSLLNNTDLEGKTILITGANSGIGFETAKALASLNGHVVMAVRNVKGSEEARMQIMEYARRKGAKEVKVDIIELDLADLESVKRCAQEFEKRFGNVHILINNAGVMMCPHATTKQGIEIQFGTNHVGHMLLTLLLLDNIKRNNARVINLSSLASEKSYAFLKLTEDVVLSDCKGKYSVQELYGRSKLANVLFTSKLQRLFDQDSNTKAQAFSVHPGVVKTNLARHLISPTVAKLLFPFVFVFKNAYEGAQTTLYCSLAPNLKGGAYYADCAEKKNRNPLAYDRNAEDELWEVSQKLINPYLSDK
jgi:retinol dehydrogenase-12